MKVENSTLDFMHTQTIWIYKLSYLSSVWKVSHQTKNVMFSTFFNWFILRDRDQIDLLGVLFLASWRWQWKLYSQNWSNLYTELKWSWNKVGLEDYKNIDPNGHSHRKTQNKTWDFFFFLIQKDRQHYIGRLNENGMWGKCDERAAAHNLLPGADPFKEL